MVEYITYKNEKHPIRLSYRMFKGLKKDLGQDVDMAKLQSLDSEVIEAMLWHGLLSGYKHEEKDCPLTKEKMEDVLDDCFFEFIKIIPKFFPNAKLGKGVPDLEQQERNNQTGSSSTGI